MKTKKLCDHWRFPVLSSPPFSFDESIFELVRTIKTRVSVLFRSNGCNFCCYFLKNTATISGGQNYMRKFFRFCAPACKANIYSLRSSYRDCCARRNLILGGGARKTSGEASRLCSHSFTRPRTRLLIPPTTQAKTTSLSISTASSTY